MWGSGIGLFHILSERFCLSVECDNMLIQTCWVGKKPGFQYYDNGRCYTYELNNIASRARAFKKAEKQGREIRIKQGKVIE